MTPLTLNDGRISSRFHGAAHGTREIPRNGVRLAGGLPGNVEVEARHLLTEGRERPVIGRHGAPTGTADHDGRADHDAEADQERSHREELDERSARGPGPRRYIVRWRYGVHVPHLAARQLPFAAANT